MILWDYSTRSSFGMISSPQMQVLKSSSHSVVGRITVFVDEKLPLLTGDATVVLNEKNIY